MLKVACQKKWFYVLTLTRDIGSYSTHWKLFLLNDPRTYIILQLVIFYTSNAVISCGRGLQLLITTLGNFFIVFE